MNFCRGHPIVFTLCLVQQHHAWDPQRFFLPQDVARGYERFLRTQLKDPHVVMLCAEEDGSGRVLGYAFARLEEVDWVMLLGPCGHFHDLLVAEEARGCGVGEALAREVMARLKALGAPRVVAHLAHANQASQALCNKLGFPCVLLDGSTAHVYLGRCNNIFDYILYDMGILI
jgi:ribosomal protein S18 acetylase RimI-like enzyme